MQRHQQCPSLQSRGQGAEAGKRHSSCHSTFLTVLDSPLSLFGLLQYGFSSQSSRCTRQGKGSRSSCHWKRRSRGFEARCVDQARYVILFYMYCILYYGLPLSLRSLELTEWCICRCNVRCWVTPAPFQKVVRSSPGKSATSTCMARTTSVKWY